MNKKEIILYFKKLISWWLINQIMIIKLDVIYKIRKINKMMKNLNYIIQNQQLIIHYN